jgi:hypothetical protein
MRCVFDTSYNQGELFIWYTPQWGWALYMIHPTIRMCCVFNTSQWGWGDASNTQFILTVGCIKYTTYTDCGMYQIHNSYWLECIKYTAHTDCGVYQIHSSYWLRDVSNTQCIPQSVWTVYLIYPIVSMCCVFDTSHSQYELCIWYIPQWVWAVYLIHPPIRMNCLWCIKYTTHTDWNVSNTQLILTVGCIKYTAHTDCGMYQIHSAYWL